VSLGAAMVIEPDNWEAVKKLFEAALEQDAGSRSDFLKEERDHPSENRP
jgi:hypothetical protein